MKKSDRDLVREMSPQQQEILYRRLYQIECRAFMIWFLLLCVLLLATETSFESRQPIIRVVLLVACSSYTNLIVHWLISPAYPMLLCLRSLLDTKSKNEIELKSDISVKRLQEYLFIVLLFLPPLIIWVTVNLR